MKTFFIGLLLFLTGVLAQAQNLYLDSSLKQKADSAQFSKDTWYWTQLIPEKDSEFIEIKSWGQVIAYTSNDTLKSGTLSTGKDKTYLSYLNILQINQDTLIVKLKGDHPLFDLSTSKIQQYTSSEWRSLERQRLIAHGIFFGIVIVMALYNLMIYFSVKDKSYLWYVLSIVGFGLYMAFYYGFTYELLWPSSPVWNAYFFALIIPLTNICRILFTQTYLHTDQYVPRWHQFFNIMQLLYLIPIATWLISWSGIHEMLTTTNHIIGILGTTTMTAMTITSIVVYRSGYKPALWVLLAFSMFNIGGILFIFRELNYFVSDNFFTRYGIQIGAVAQVVLFSLGLADRLNRARKMLTFQKIEKEKLELEKETERKRLIENQRNQLEVQVKERTKELEQTLQQLRLSESELKELNKVKSKLFSIISHELKSPLTTVDAYLNLFINHYHKLSQEDLSALSNKTRFSLQNLTLLMDNLLLWSRLQQDRLTFDPILLDLRRIIDKSVKLFALLMEQKNIKLVIEDEVDESMLYADKNMLEFIVRNLIHNAIKFTPKNGQITIAVSHDGGMSTISIQDTGIGMTHEMIGQILKKGESFTRTGTEQEKGSGIGLLMCKDFVEKNGGQLLITADRGTTVSFTVYNSSESFKGSETSVLV
ncbi:MAG: sensor histidine kinase [Bacteroidota bacterium]